MAYLDDLHNIATILLQEYTNKNLVPEWFSTNMKTLLSKNITIEDWNNVQWYLKNVAAENEAVFKFCQNLNSALTNFESNVNSAISQTANNVMNAATAYTDTKISEQDAKVVRYAEAIDNRFANTDSALERAFSALNLYATKFEEQESKRIEMGRDLSAQIETVDVKYYNVTNNINTNLTSRISDVENSITGVHMTLQNEYPHLENQKIPSKYLPSYVDDVIEVPGIHNQTTGEFNKIYVDVNTNKMYRWNGAQNGMVELGNVSQKETWKFTLEDGTVVEKEVHTS